MIPNAISVIIAKITNEPNKISKFICDYYTSKIINALPNNPPNIFAIPGLLKC